MDTCLRLYVTKYEVVNFPYERALALWKSERERRGKNNIINFSNKLDVEHNVLDDHNGGSSREGHVQNVKNEDQGQNVNWTMNFK